MKRIFLFLAVTLALSGCNSDEADLAGYLGIKVTRFAPKDDRCATQQVTKLVDGFDKLEEAEQTAIKQRVKKYGEIDLLPAVIRQTLSGKKTDLHYEDEVCGYEEYCKEVCNTDKWGHQPSVCSITERDTVCRSKYVCNDVSKVTKTIYDTVVKQGSDLSVVELAGKITISPSKVDDQVLRKLYATESKTFYENVNSVSDPAFKSAVDNKLLTEKYVYSLSGCGTPMTIHEFAELL